MIWHPLIATLWILFTLAFLFLWLISQNDQRIVLWRGWRYAYSLSEPDCVILGYSALTLLFLRFG